jgi:hypothetical protein
MISGAPNQFCPPAQLLSRFARTKIGNASNSASTAKTTIANRDWS